MEKRIPIHGSMTRPGNIEEGYKELKKSRLKADFEFRKVITFSTKEFTSVCPTTQQPDFGVIEISYVPDRYYLESKAIKFWLWSFRDHGAHCEKLSDLLCKHIADAIAPHEICVRVTQAPRGGITIVAETRLDQS